MIKFKNKPVYLLSFVFSLHTTYLICRLYNLNMIELFVFSLIIVVFTFVGTCVEYIKTAICVLPFTYISLTMIADKLFSYGKEMVK